MKIPSRTSRERTSFDTELELPRLKSWFAENPHPSRSTLQMYVKELNSLPSRQSRKLLEVHNLCYWFKNARAAYKRAEQRLKRSIEPQHLASSHVQRQSTMSPGQQSQRSCPSNSSSYASSLANSPPLGGQPARQFGGNIETMLPQSSSSSPQICTMSMVYTKDDLTLLMHLGEDIRQQIYIMAARNLLSLN